MVDPAWMLFSITSSYQPCVYHARLITLCGALRTGFSSVNIPPTRYNLMSHILIYDEEYLLASNKGRAYFSLVGYHFNPADITRLLGVEPTTVNDAGTKSGLDNPAISSWELSTETVSGDVDVYALTEIILKQLESVKPKILDVCKSHNLSPRMGVVLTLSVDKDQSSPEVGFGARMIRFLADIGAFINVDYELSERI